MSGNRPEVVSQRKRSQFTAQDLGTWLAPAIALVAGIAMLLGVASFFLGPAQ